MYLSDRLVGLDIVRAEPWSAKGHSMSNPGSFNSPNGNIHNSRKIAVDCKLRLYFEFKAGLLMQRPKKKLKMLILLILCWNGM